MGRYVHCKETGDIVAKYWFAAQPSEQLRIAEELNIGDITYGEDHDVLTLNRRDLHELKEFLNRDDVKKVLETGDELVKRLRDDDGGIPSYLYDVLVVWGKINDYFFYDLVRAYVEYMEQHPEIDTFSFDGEY